jgi:hypothetical protein
MFESIKKLSVRFLSYTFNDRRIMLNRKKRDEAILDAIWGNGGNKVLTAPSGKEADRQPF